MIISGPSSQLLAGRVSAIVGRELALCEYRTFPDGESYSQVVSDLEDDLVILQSTPTDKDLIYLMQLLDVAMDKKITLVVPYFGYARQDKIFKHGEPMTARAIITALNPFLVNGARVFTVNIHSPAVLSHFKCNAVNLDATPLLAEKIRQLDLCNPVIISPDKGAVNMAKAAADLIGVPFDHLQKTRLSGSEVVIAPKEIDVMGRDIVITDDMIATGGTMATAIELLKKQGAKRVYIAAVHAVLTGSALLKLQRAGVEAVIATDTLDRGVSSVSVAPVIARALCR
jgi:ribose-phosphate pyrophosphokinase